MITLYIDGGCSGNGQKNLARRRMVSVVTDEDGNVLVDKFTPGGSNNIAEFIAAKEALIWASVHGVKCIDIITDSRNTIEWWNKRSTHFRAKINDPELVSVIKTEIEALKLVVSASIRWVPREYNKAGHYIENKYAL